MRFDSPPYDLCRRDFKMIIVKLSYPIGVSFAEETPDAVQYPVDRQPGASTRGKTAIRIVDNTRSPTGWPHRTEESRSARTAALLNPELAFLSAAKEPHDLSRGEEGLTEVAGQYAVMMTRSGEKLLQAPGRSDSRSRYRVYDSGRHP